jgi:hypothetical protein
VTYLRFSLSGSVGRSLGGGDGGEGEGEKVAAAALGESGRRLHEGGVLPYKPSVSGLVWAIKRVM